VDGWGHTQSGSTATTEKVEKAQGIASQAATMATGAGQFAYGTVVGDEKSKQAGRDAMFGQWAWVEVTQKKTVFLADTTSLLKFCLH
jgi:hypothetical protein